MRWFRFAAALLAGLGSAAAEPATVTVRENGAALALTLPEGYCALSEAIKGHRKLLTYARRTSEGANDVLAIAGACADVDALAHGKITALNESYLVLSPVIARGANLKGGEAQGLSAVCHDLKRAAGPLASADLGPISSRFDAMFAHLAPGDLAPLGIFVQTGALCYNGFVSRRTARDGQPLRLLMLSGMTVVNGVLAQVVHTRIHDGRASLAEDAGAFEANLEANIEGNAAK